MTQKSTIITGVILVVLGIWSIWSPEKIQGLVVLVLGALILYKSKSKKTEEKPTLPMGTM